MYPPLIKGYLPHCLSNFPAESASSVMAPANITVSLITNLPAPDNSGKPCSPLPKSGTQHSGVVIRKDSVPMVIMIQSNSPKIPILGENITKKTKIPIDIIRHPNP